MVVQQLDRRFPVVRQFQSRIVQVAVVDHFVLHLLLFRLFDDETPRLLFLLRRMQFRPSFGRRFGCEDRSLRSDNRLLDRRLQRYFSCRSRRFFRFRYRCRCRHGRRHSRFFYRSGRDSERYLFFHRFRSFRHDPCRNRRCDRGRVTIRIVIVALPVERVDDGLAPLVVAHQVAPRTVVVLYQSCPFSRLGPISGLVGERTLLCRPVRIDERRIPPVLYRVLRIHRRIRLDLRSHHLHRQRRLFVDGRRKRHRFRFVLRRSFGCGLSDNRSRFRLSIGRRCRRFRIHSRGRLLFGQCLPPDFRLCLEAHHLFPGLQTFQLLPHVSLFALAPGVCPVFRNGVPDG